jgi:hypothetical protein
MAIECLLGILASKCAKYIFKNYLNHTVHTQEGDVCEFHLCQVDEKGTANFTALVRSIIKNQESDLRYTYYKSEQKEIDTLVYQLYGLTDEEIREVELWY